ncbi:UDP-N-acetylmuramate:L-alanyl-gamma-D-glutamyl-meso-diaminopimelate ligase [Halioxenophilus aromaticivorans]|uniref:UDP-N-acetylmuramate--L-alanyl-gamma-D-glutamyl-meso-2,6-diaminoheptandioate ligase n=1 Tax=Halioxenophilus aromaticivorans TaxID=1306992 RepID=A0AAV3U139_9ALTE
MHVHILGICGTFMGSLAQLAKALGHRVTGSDANVYPPMSTQLESAGIEIFQGFGEEQFVQKPDLVVIGNAMSRGNPAVEYVLERGLPYTSGPQWLNQALLPGKWVLAASGTHGKTTTASMIAWVLEHAGFEPGFLIGGVPGNFEHSARLGKSDFFVVEADEYDTAFFDKRSKFLHYQPRTLVINNLEYDHADIFPDLAAIQTQFHHVIRTVPASGTIIYPEGVTAIDAVLAKGCWSQTAVLGRDWQAQALAPSGASFKVLHKGEPVGEVHWQCIGQHNVCNGLAAIAAAHSVGIAPADACAALNQFKGVKRRMELLADVNGTKVYDDFAHHPTAIATTLEGLRAQVGNEPITAVVELRSNTMKSGVHNRVLAQSCCAADRVLWYQAGGDDSVSLDDLVHHSCVPAKLCQSLDDIITTVTRTAQAPGHVVVMSNGGFGGVHQSLVAALKNR